VSRRKVDRLGSFWHRLARGFTLIALAPAGAAATTLTLDPLFPSDTIAAPVHVAAPPGDDDRLFILDREGRISVYDRPSETLVRDQADPYFDLGASVDLHAFGAFALAFDPDFESNRRLYVSFADAAGDHRVISVEQDAAESLAADASTLETVITVDHPDDGVDDHFAGWIGFGPEDGALYVTTGDSNADPINAVSQDFSNRLGAVLRIDPDGDDFPGDADNNFAVPGDNPFADDAGIDGALFAKGLRNPWRASFDPVTGMLVIADVGEDTREEIDLGAPRANYGWPGFEGDTVFDPGPGHPDPDSLAVDPALVTDPIYAYGHDLADPFGGRSVTGGAVYRGPVSALDGLYLFADFVAPRVWSFRIDPDDGSISELTSWDLSIDGATLDSPVSFGRDSVGNLYLVDLHSTSDVFLISAATGLAAVALPAGLGPLAAALALLGALGVRRRTGAAPARWNSITAPRRLP